jgi:outer membrane protein assembly factor BamB
MRGVDIGRTGIEPGPVPTEQPGELWRTPTGWHTEAQPIVARGLIYFGGFSLGERTPQLSAVDEDTGQVRWQTTAPVAWAEFPDAPALAGEVLFAPVQAPVAGVMAVAAATGDPLWFAPFGFTTMNAPVVDGNAVYISGWGVRNPRDRALNDTVGMVVALDQRSGRELWRFLTSARFDAISASPSLVYVPSERGLFALDRRTGGKLWQARFSPGAGETAIVASSLVVFPGWEITSGKRGIFAVDAATGALKWRQELPADPTSRAGGAVSNGTVFISAWEAPPDDSAAGVPTLSAFDLESGDVRWQVQARSDASGDTVGAGSITSPVIVDSTVVFGVAVRSPAPTAEDASGLYAVEASSGKLLWHAGGEPIRSAPSVLDGSVFAMGGLRARGGATGGNLFAFGAG